MPIHAQPHHPPRGHTDVLRLHHSSRRTILAAYCLCPPSSAVDHNSMQYLRHSAVCLDGRYLPNSNTCGILRYGWVVAPYHPLLVGEGKG